MLGNYLQQPTSADDIFRCISFLGALRVKLTQAVSLTDLGKRSLDKRLIYSHILHVTLKTDNCLLGHRRHSLDIILVRVLKFNAKFFYYSQFYQNTDKLSR